MPDHRTPLATAVQAGKPTDCRHSREAFDTLFRLVAERTDISSDAKLVHGAHVSMHRLGESWTQTKIGEKVGLTRHEVWYGQQELIRAGLLRVERVGLGQPNRYELLGIPAEDLAGRAPRFRPVRQPHAGQSGTAPRGPLRNQEYERKNVSHSGYDVAAYLAHEQATYSEASKRYGVRR